MTTPGDFAAILEDRGRQATRQILEAKERIADPALSDADAAALRAVIVDQVAAVARLGAMLLRNLQGQLVDQANVSVDWLEAIGGALDIERPPATVPAPELARSNGHGRS